MNLNIIIPNFSRQTIKSSLLRAKEYLNPKRCHLNLQKKHKSSVKWSYVHREGFTPLTCKHLGNFIDEAADNYGDTEAVVNNVQDIRKTYTQFVKEIDELAAGLLSLNLNIGDRVGIWGPNSYEWILSQFAAAKAGLIIVPINPAFQKPEVYYCIQKVNMKAMIIHDKFKTQDYHQILANLIPEINQTKKADKIKNKSHPYFESIITMSDQNLPGAFKLTDLMQSHSKQHKADLTRRQDIMQMDTRLAIMFTSGTTGNPKGVIWNHFIAINRFFTSRYKNHPPFGTTNERSLALAPLFHGLGYLTAIHMLVDGHTTVLTGPVYNPGLALKTIQDEKTTFTSATPTMFFDMLNHPDAPKTNVSSMTAAKMGGSLCPPPLIKRLKDEWNITNVLNGYGSTETCGSACFVEAGDSWEDKITTSGKPVDYMEVKIVDLQNRLVPIGESGEICCRGYKVMVGYWNDEEKTREVLTSDGWYHTGDVGIMTESGCIKIVDRLRDMIIRGGENVYPKEIEDVLLTHPKISESYVIGVPDERLGEEVCVWVKCKQGETMTEQELKEFCKGKLARLKTPKYIRYVQEFPKTISGKVLKHVMRAEEAKLH